MIQTTEQELQAIVAQLKPYIMEYIRQYSVGVGEIELATTLEGIYSLPALMRIGGVDKIVEAPLTLLRAAVDEVVEECVKAAEAANAAAQTATEAGNNAVAAVSDLEELKVTLTQAIADASSAAQAANTAKDNANTAAGSANTAAGKATTAANRATQVADNPPKIGDNGNWWIWKESSGKYEDSGILAQGGFILPSFSMDDETNLIMEFADSDTMSPEMFGYDETTGEFYFNTND